MKQPGCWDVISVTGIAAWSCRRGQKISTMIVIGNVNATVTAMGGAVTNHAIFKI